MKKDTISNFITTKKTKNMLLNSFSEYKGIGTILFLMIINLSCSAPNASDLVGTNILVADLSASSPFIIGWQKSILKGENDSPSKMIISSDNNIVVAIDEDRDVTSSNRLSGISLVKLSNNGEQIWIKKLGTSNSNYSNIDFLESNDAGFVIVSEFWEKNDDFFRVTKFNKSGNEVWEVKFNGSYRDTGASIVKTQDNGYIIAGLTQDYFYANVLNSDKTQKKSDNEYWIVKIDDKGKKVWDKSFGIQGTLDICKIIATKDNSFLIAGGADANSGVDKTNNSKGITDYWIIKIDNQGNKIWDKTLGGNHDDRFKDISLSLDGGFFIGGVSSSSASGDKSEDFRLNKGYNFGKDYWLIRLDSNGNKIWDKTIGGNGDDFLISVNTTSDGGCLLHGSSQSEASFDKTSVSQGAWTVKLEKDGKKIWDLTESQRRYEFLYSDLKTGFYGFVGDFLKKELVITKFK